MQRNTKQRTAVLENLRNRRDHPIADMVYVSVRETLPNVSKGTIYRNLKNLTDEWQIISFTENGVEHFDGVMKPHVHYICKECGQIDDLFFEDDREENVTTEDGFYIRNVQIEGVCAECMKKHSK